MIDMVHYSDTKLNIHYNKLKNELRNQEGQNDYSLFKVKSVCAPTSRAISLIKDIYTAPEKAKNSPASVMQFDLSKETQAYSVKQVSATRPGHVYFGDIDSDGFPDLLATL